MKNSTVHFFTFCLLLASITSTFSESNSESLHASIFKSVDKLSYGFRLGSPGTVNNILLFLLHPSVVVLLPFMCLSGKFTALKSMLMLYRRLILSIFNTFAGEKNTYRKSKNCSSRRHCPGCKSSKRSQTFCDHQLCYEELRSTRRTSSGRF